MCFTNARPWAARLDSEPRPFEGSRVGHVMLSVKQVSSDVAALPAVRVSSASASVDYWGPSAPPMISVVPPQLKAPQVLPMQLLLQVQSQLCGPHVSRQL